MLDQHGPLRPHRGQVCDEDAPGAALRLFWQGKPVVRCCNLSSLAERLLVPENAVVKIADDIPLNIGSLVGCAVITGAGAVINTARCATVATSTTQPSPQRRWQLPRRSIGLDW